ncbi:DUF547 domain-containing protein [Faecalimicrobium dakarense]|uniref:DUF547 domain-containing protein n=1 Tax=Faecalimicrobium dakarense TaxID=1301100 RepID=UPI0004AE1FA9|nr:DUF547 domain-containing protein [[Clostridium] dakarense]
MNSVQDLSVEFSVLAKNKKYEWIYSNNLDLEEMDYLYNKLKYIDLDKLVDEDAKKAFYINIYNGLVNYFIIKMRLKDFIPKGKSFFRNQKANIGGYMWSLDDIEHGILRKNKRPLNSFRLLIKDDDPRKKYILDNEDCRIHFALNCGGKSCPAIRAYTSDNINNELNISEEVFINSEIEIDDVNRTIVTSKLFKWYRKDFKNRYIFIDEYKGYRIIYRDYSWSLI